MKIKSIYFPQADDEANASWDDEACRQLVDEGNHVFSVKCRDGEIIEYHFNEDFTTVQITIGEYSGSAKPVRVTFEEE